MLWWGILLAGIAITIYLDDRKHKEAMERRELHDEHMSKLDELKQELQWIQDQIRDLKEPRNPITSWPLLIPVEERQQ